MYATKKNKNSLLQKKDFFLLRSLGTREANLYSIDYQHDLCMPIKEPLDANSRKLCEKCKITYIWSKGNL